MRPGGQPWRPRQVNRRPPGAIELPDLGDLEEDTLPPLHEQYDAALAAARAAGVSDDEICAALVRHRGQGWAVLLAAMRNCRRLRH